MAKHQKQPTHCTYCMKEVHYKVDGGKVQLPVSITLGQFREYNQPVLIHNACLNPLIKQILILRN